MTPPFFPEHFDPSMAYRRYMTSRDYQHVPEKTCKWCLKPVSGRRTSWCSDACRANFLIRFSGGIASAMVLDRDHGICANCGIDTKELERWYRLISKNTWKYWEHKAAWGPWYSHNSFWEADHIVPVSEGGGCCGLENYRTLCMRCHKAESAELRRRLSSGHK